MAKNQHIDPNGFVTFRNCKFFCEMVAQYLGEEIDPDGKMGLNPKGIYNVFRPKSEIAKPEFVESLNAKPLLDDHTVIGNVDGFENPDKTNTAGVLSEVKVVGNSLVGRIDVWSPRMLEKIANGKRELSLSYGCDFVPRKGVYKGQRYDFIQSNLMCGNHLALVDTARNGHDCRIMDGMFVRDEKIQLEKPEMDISKLSADEVVEALKGCSDEVKAKCKDFLNTPTEEGKKPDEKNEDAKPEEVKPEEAKPEDAKPEETKSEEPKPADSGCANPDDGNKAKEEKAAEDAAKVEEEKAKACDAAIKEYQGAIKLAEECKPMFGTISMDGIKTQKDLAIKVCALDSAPKFLKDCKPDEKIVALRGYLASGKASSASVVSDSAKNPKKKTWAEYMSAR